MKAFQLIRHLVDRGVDVTAITHERNRAELEEAFPAESLVFVSDGLLQRLAWRSRVFRFAVTPLFHLAVLRILRRFDPRTTTLHFVTPISPVQPRFYPKDFRTVIGPTNVLSKRGVSHASRYTVFSRCSCQRVVRRSHRRLATSSRPVIRLQPKVATGSSGTTGKASGRARCP